MLREDDVGLRPTPRQGALPPAPRSLGLRPKGSMSLVVPFCFGLAFPFGAAPQNPTRASWRGTSFLLEMKLRKAAGSSDTS